jgi:DNA-binding GntR family transcriptional regulator
MITITVDRRNTLAVASEVTASADEPQLSQISQLVYGELRQAILDGTLQAGDRVVEAEVARKLGVSRAPVREALRRLQQAGLVEHRPRHGWFAIGLTPADMWDLYLVRASVEGISARRASTQAPPDLLAELEALIEKMVVSAEHEDLEDLAANDVRFHELIIQSSGSSLLHRIWRLLYPEVWTSMSLLRLKGVALTEIAERHRIVVDALASKDQDWAEAVIKRHILEIGRRVVAPAQDSRERGAGSRSVGIGG